MAIRLLAGAGGNTGQYRSPGRDSPASVRRFYEGAASLRIGPPQLTRIYAVGLGVEARYFFAGDSSPGRGRSAGDNKLVSSAHAFASRSARYICIARCSFVTNSA